MLNKQAAANLTVNAILAGMVLKRISEPAPKAGFIQLDTSAHQISGFSRIVYDFGENNFDSFRHIYVEGPNIRKAGQAVRKSTINNDFNWFKRHYGTLKRKYNGQWIAIVNEKFICAGPSFAEVYKQAKELGYVRPFITRVSDKWESR